MTIRDPIEKETEAISSAPLESELVEGGYGTTDIPIAEATAMEIEEYPPGENEPTKLQTAVPTGGPVFRANATQYQTPNHRSRKDYCSNQSCCCITSIVLTVVFLCCALPVILFFVIAATIPKEITFDDDFFNPTFDDDFFTKNQNSPNNLWGLENADDFLDGIFTDGGN